MKKAFLKAVAVFAGFVLASNVFAGEKFEVMSESAALQKRAEFMAQNKDLLRGGVKRTMIVVTNYDDPNDVGIRFSNGQKLGIPHRSALVYTNEGASERPRVELFNCNNVKFFDQTISSYALVGIYIEDGLYQPRVTNI